MIRSFYGIGQTWVPWSRSANNPRGRRFPIRSALPSIAPGWPAAAILKWTLAQLGAGIVALVVLVSASASLVSAQSEWIVVETPRFRVEAVKDHQAQASWYAAFVEQVHGELSDLLGATLDRPIRVRLYPTEEAYVTANPAAVRSHGILAHAKPAGDEIGMALVRLEALPGSSRVGAFRHELAHLLLSQRSGGRLPIGFHEGIAQYVEQDPKTEADSMEGLRRALTARRLLSWNDLNRTTEFMNQPDVAYPQSYAMVAYLAEQHGLGNLMQLLDALRDGHNVSDAILASFHLSVEDLERDWRASIPGSVLTGLPRNVLSDGNLRPAQEAALEQRWVDAAGLARRSEQFWTNLRHETRAAEARALADRADAVSTFQRAFIDAEQLLNIGAYAQASVTIRTGLARVSPSIESEMRQQLEHLAARADAGTIGMEALRQAHEAMDGYRIIDGQRFASLAEQQLTRAGNTDGAVEARLIRDHAQNLQQMAAMAALIIAFMSGGFIWASRPRTITVTPPAGKQEIRL
ncbi:MAG: peptidase MA family metallohydrolase [Chloroflexota bacterium]